MTKDDGLAEEIIFNGHSKFLQITREGEPVILDEINLSKDKGIILKSHKTVGNLPPITPHNYNDVQEIRYFIDLAQRMNIDDLYFLAKSIWKSVVATKEKELIILLTADTIVSYFQDLFVTTHYVLLTGPPGWGKGVILITFKILGYRVILGGDMSGANLLDLLGSVERCQVSIAEDELDNIADDPDKQRIYKMGYEDVGLVTRTVDPSSSDRDIKFYNPYCIKFFASEKATDTKELGGFNDRTLISEVRKGRPKFLIKEIKKQMERPLNKQLPKYRTIVSRINFLRKILLIYRLIHHGDIIEEIVTNIDSRPLELCGPALRLFNSDKLAKEDKKALDEIRLALSHFLRKKGELDKKTIEAVIYDVLKEMFDEMDKGNIGSDFLCKREVNNDLDGTIKITYTITYDKICSRIMEAVEGNLISQRTFESADHGRTTHDSLLTKCRNVFEGKNARLGRDKDNKKALKFDKDRVDEAGCNFDVVSEIKIFEEEEEEVTSEDPEEAARWGKWSGESEGGGSQE